MKANILKFAKSSLSKIPTHILIWALVFFVIFNFIKGLVESVVVLVVCIFAVYGFYKFKTRK